MYYACTAIIRVLSVLLKTAKVTKHRNLRLARPTYATEIAPYLEEISKHSLLANRQYRTGTQTFIVKL